MSGKGSTALITGGAGFIGSNLADRLAAEGCRVLVFDSLARDGVKRNLEWLRERRGRAIVPFIADVRDRDSLERAVDRADVVFHLAAQVAVTTSLVDPREDFDINLGGAINVLETARRRNIPLIFASTNKVYGDLAGVPLRRCGDAYVPVDPTIHESGVGEGQPLDFHTPYGCSKGAADQYVLDYARSYGLPTCVFRMSCIYGPRQMGTEDQGWVAHFLLRALRNEAITLYGDGRQVRDILHVDDAVQAYLTAWRRIGEVRGQAFNLGGGPANAVSLRQVIGHAETLLGRSVVVDHRDWRAGDQRYYVSDNRAVRQALGLGEPKAWRDGLADLVGWLRAERDGSAAEPSSDCPALELEPARSAA